MPSFRFIVSLLIGCALLSLSTESKAQSTINFSSGDLQGISLTNPTSLQFGPDGRLYISQQNGLIYSLLVQRNGASDYSVVETEVIDLVQDIPNHNDDLGDLNASVTTRQVTGLLVAGTSANPVLYVTSSDPRIGAGGGGEDLNLDTNSGTLSKLTWTGTSRDDASGSWEKVDLVRGLPRSEENHSSNGLQLSVTGDTLFIAQGGHTNAGAPSNNFAFQTEYALAAAILSVDLSAIEALPVQGTGDNAYVYDLPTLDDPTRPNANGVDDPADPSYTGVDVGDPFGGNDGLNQAKLVEGGPVQIHASGFRNPYDLVLTASAGQEGRMYVIDNGPNGGWGGHPAGEADYPGETTVGLCTNEYLEGEPGSTGPGPGGDPKVNNLDNLHYVRDLANGDMYYGGHPTPIRGNPDGAGIYKDSIWVVPGAPSDSLLPPDWPAVPSSMAYAAECDYRSPGTDGSLVQYAASTNGIVEYTASNLDGAMQGNLLLASFDGNIYRVALNSTGDGALVNESFASGFGSTPLDVTAQGDNALFGGTVWAATYGSSGITVFEPADYDGNTVPSCSGTDDASLDDDGDGYSNADEIDNGTNPCSGASQPTDFDGDLVSDLNDPDDDDDGIEDVSDVFAIDASNGLDNTLPISYNLFNNDPGTGFFGVGFTGLMSNGSTDYLNQFSQDSLIAGGTAGIFTITDVPGGTPLGAENDQRYAFQFGAAVDVSNAPYTVEAQMNGPFFDGKTPEDFQSQGIYVGTGDQDNYVKVVLNANGGAGGIQVVQEENGVVSSTAQYAPTGLLSVSNIKFFLSVDPGAGTVQPRYAVGGGAVTDLGSPLALDPAGSLLAAVQSTGQALAVGVIATSREASSTFDATWDYLQVDEDVQSSTASVAITPSSDINASTYSSGAFTITNTSTGGEAITSVRLDLSTGALPDMVFDPNGEAGDLTAKGFTPDAGGSATGLAGHTLSGFHNGVDASDGYDVLEISFSDFQPGESFSFSIDVDPNSIKGTAAPGPGESGSVSGLELVGSAVDVTFDDGLTHAASLYRGPDASTVSGGSAALRSGAPAQPTVEVVGLSAMPATVTDAQQTVRVSGPVGASVRLLVLEGALYEPSGGAYNVDPYDVNSVVGVQEATATLDASGQADIDITLTKSDPSGGYHYIVATVEDEAGITGPVSAPAIVEYEPQVLSSVYRINAGGSSYTDVDGETWSADQYSTGGKTYSKNVSIGNSDDDALYQSERYGDYAYSIPVDNGTYAVKLHFAEIYWGIGGGSGVAGERVFDVSIENGQAGLTNYDILADVGAPATAVVKSFNGIDVADGELNIAFSTVVDNAKVSAIEILESSQPQYTLAADVSGGGAVSKNPDQTGYGDGDVVELTAVPDSGWAFDSWSGDLTGSSNPASLTVSGDMSVTATFVPTYTLAVTTVGSGTVTQSPDNDTYVGGETVELTATPASGWMFGGWSGDVATSVNPLSLDVTSDVSVTATFVEQPSAASFTASLRVADAEQHSQALTFGTNENATEGFDAVYDEKAPPPPPSGAFDARLENPNAGDAFWKDVRPVSSSSGALTWQVHVQAASGASPIELTWDPGLLPVGSFRLQDVGDGSTVDGSQINVNMKTRDAYVIADGSISTLKIVYTVPDPSTLVARDAGHTAGWNLIGMPLDTGPVPFATLFPAAESETLVGFRGASYERSSRLALGRGYWLEFTSSGTQTVDGYPTSSVELAMSPGWNLVTGPSACSFALPLSSEYDPAGVVTTVYAFENGAYAVADTLKPGQGYWAQASTAGVITLDCNAAESSSALAAMANGTNAKQLHADTQRSDMPRQTQLLVEDEGGARQTLLIAPGASSTSTGEKREASSYALPPRPPAGAFDVRFEDDMRRSTSLESHALVQTSHFPVTIEAVGALAGSGHALTVLYGSTQGATYELRSGSRIRLTDDKITGFVVTLSEQHMARLPEAFVLHSNYPNPVTTTTQIGFDLPEPAQVRVDVYNVLGQRVQQIGPRRFAAGGGQTLRVDASTFASGVYFYRMTAEMGSDTVSRVGKMVVAR